MKALSCRILLLPVVVLLLSHAAIAQAIPAAMSQVVAALQGARLVVETPGSTGYPHLIKGYSQVSSDGCVLHYVETADESGKLVDGKPETRHSTYAFTVDLAQAVVKDVRVVGQRSDHLYYSVPMVFTGEQPIEQNIQVNGVQTTSATLKHTTASFEVEGKEFAAKLQGALSAAIQACAAR
jgi:hypothetical protein